MNLNNLRKLLIKRILKKSSDKFSIFIDKRKLSKYDLNEAEIIDLINEFLSDEQKAELFNFDYYKNASLYMRKRIVETVSSSNIRADLIQKSNIVLELESYESDKIIASLEDNDKIKILNNSQISQKLGKDGITILINSLCDKKKQEVLLDEEFVLNKLNLTIVEIINFTKRLKTEKAKLKIIEIYNIKKNDDILEIVETLSDEIKTEIILKNKYNFEKCHLIMLASTLSTNGLVDFLKNSEDFLEKNRINPYEITIELDEKEQLNFISKIEDTGLSLKKKRQIFATLKENTKKDVDTTHLLPEYLTAIEMQYSYGKIVVDINKDIEIYDDLEELITINPMQISDEDKEKLVRLFETYPQINIIDNLGVGTSTQEEYRSAETWIETVIHNINSEWTDVQKLAFIDNAIGKKICYSPDFDTEIFNRNNARALWRVIDSGYGVCNGIAQVEQYILKKIGIEAEIVSSENHAFLKIKNIELSNGSKGDTIVDPTWNLTTHRYDAMPENFCKSYEDIRENDIDDDKIDTQCHKNDEELADKTIGLEEKELRKVFTSVGLANKDGKFSLESLIEISDIVGSFNFSEEEAINRQFEILSNYYPEFATCINATSTILQSVILNQDNLKFKRCVVSRVYEKKDKGKRPVLYVYADFPKAGKKFYYADKEKGCFLELSQKEFESRFECYKKDMEKQDGNRPWEIEEGQENMKDLSQSSKKKVAREGR